MGLVVAGGYGLVKNALGSSRIVKNVGLVARKITKSQRQINKISSGLETYFGEGSRAFRNMQGDLLIESKNGLRQFRIDLNHTYPHQNPHSHLIEFGIKKNKKVELQNMRIYPSNVNPG